MIVSSDNESVVDESFLTSFVFTRLVVPRVCPELQIINQEFSRFMAEVVNDHSLLSLVAIPPLSLSLDISIWMITTGFTSLTGSRGSPIPKAVLRLSSNRQELMVLFNTLKLVIAANFDISRNGIHVSLLGVLVDGFPVCLTIALHGSSSMFPGPF